eukprot:TRINITY_DN9381_c0_g1_i4.p1 TRINITY_DN9381_c0_g1~~TRINITY_DN9381_c0_g1_i4.p1  ORF type:complete len:338 (+),score=70.82 TRINITY_DN9381_c0_g1_i4:224-1237(+)
MLSDITEVDLKVDFNIGVRLHRNKILSCVEDLKRKPSVKCLESFTSPSSEQPGISSKAATCKTMKPKIGEGMTMKLAVPLIRLKCIEGQFVGNEWIITETCNVLGKSSSPNTVTLVDGYLSSKHCQLITSEGKIYIKDLGSTNGTFVMTKEPTELSVDSIFKMGNNEFKVVSIGEQGVLRCSEGVMEGKLFEVKRGEELTVGRKKENRLCIPEDEALSSLHGKVFFKDGKLYVSDENSTNKTWIRISDEKVESKLWELGSDAVFMVGDNTYMVSLFGAGNEEVKEDETNLCKVCYAKEFNVAFAPCGHCACDDCVKTLKICHVCRTPIQSVVKIYRA